MRVRDVLATARKRAGLPESPSSNTGNTEYVMDLQIVALGTSEVIRKVQPEIARRTYELDGNQTEIHLPFPLLTVENLYLNGADLSSHRVAPQQMQTNTESQNV